MSNWNEKDTGRYGVHGQFTLNEAVRHGLEMAADYMRRAGLSSKKIFDELVFQCEGEGIPESVISDVAKGNYTLLKPRGISERPTVLGDLATVDCGL